MDKKDKRLVRILWNTPHASITALAAATGVSQDTVRRHIAALEKDGMLARRKHVAVRPEALGWLYRCLIFTRTDAHALAEVPASGGPGYTSEKELADCVMDLPKKSGYAEQLAVLAYYLILGGQCDIVFELCAEDEKVAGTFIAEHLGKLRGIVETNTATAFDHFRKLLGY